MDWTTIIAKINASEIDGAEEIAKAATDYVNGLNDRHTEDVEKLTGQVENLTTAIGIDTGDTQSRIDSATKAITTLTEERDGLKADKEKLEGSIAQNQRQDLIRKAATLTKANETVLASIIGAEEIAIADGKATIAGKDMGEWLKENKTEFVPALFPTPTGGKPPGAAPHKDPERQSEADDKTEKSAVDNYFERHYSQASSS